MDYIYYFDLFGTFVFAVTGAIRATGRHMDLFGVLTVGFVTAVGGGSVRDLLIGRTPVFWLHDIYYLYMIIIASLLTFSFSRFIIKINNILRFADAIGIGVFTIIGLQQALSVQLAAPFAILMGVITAVVGGMIRDILCQEVPLVLHREVYATACILGGIFFFLLRTIILQESIVVIISILCIIGIRILSILFDVSLPKVHDS